MGSGEEGRVEDLIRGRMIDLGFNERRFSMPLLLGLRGCLWRGKEGLSSGVNKEEAEGVEARS